MRDLFAVLEMRSTDSVSNSMGYSRAFLVNIVELTESIGCDLMQLKQISVVSDWKREILEPVLHSFRSLFTKN